MNADPRAIAVAFFAAGIFIFCVALFLRGLRRRLERILAAFLEVRGYFE